LRISEWRNTKRKQTKKKLTSINQFICSQKLMGLKYTKGRKEHIIQENHPNTSNYVADRFERVSINHGFHSTTLRESKSIELFSKVETECLVLFSMWKQSVKQTNKNHKLGDNIIKWDQVSNSTHLSLLSFCQSINQSMNIHRGNTDVRNSIHSQPYHLSKEDYKRGQKESERESFTMWGVELYQSKLSPTLKWTIDFDFPIMTMSQSSFQRFHSHTPTHPHYYY
jgi:hypothetical protein